MGLFRDKAPHLITQKEVTGNAWHAGLMQKVKAHGFMDTKGLNKRELETFSGIMSGHMDPEKTKGGFHGTYFRGIDENEAEQIIQQVKQNSDFSPKKAAHIEEHMRKYLDKKMV